MNRGSWPPPLRRPVPTTTEAVLGALHDAYADEPFVVVSERSPPTKATLGSNTAHVTARADERTGWVVAICAIDNLVKGASGQAVQVRQPSPSASRDHRPAPPPGSTRDQPHQPLPRRMVSMSVTAATGSSSPPASTPASRRT